MDELTKRLGGMNHQRRFAHQHQLTPREVEVLELLCDGKTNDQITAELNVCKKTTEHHLTKLYRKLSVQSRLEATIHAIKNGFIARD